MSIGSVIGGVPSLKKLQGASNDDWIDRLNHVWTVFLFAMFAIIVSTGQFVGDPIHCWCPAEFTGAYVDYAKSYCWIKNTYYIAMDEQIPLETIKRENEELTYYQWVPLILLFQAFMFKFPNIVWRLFNGGSGINLDKVVEMAEKTQMGSPDDRKKTIEHIALYMDRWLETHREYHWNMLVRAKQTMARFCCFFCNKRAGTYLTAFYLTTKVLYAVNVISQFFILNAFLSTDYNLYGFEVLAKLGQGDAWKESTRFPRVTLCDFRIRQLQNIQNWTVQCVLPINLFNEKIFIFIWFWLVLVAFLTCLNLVAWFYRVIVKRNRSAYIKKYLKINNELHTGFDKKLCNKFAEQYLRDDGVFVMRVIAKNSTDLVVTDLVDKMWKLYKGKSGPKPSEEPTEPTLPIDKEKEALTGE
ncbi:innexin unc-9-like isoform X2 [Babylonia areolata]|uniref:innexin unc-9-like isoform X1 n=1 Tax=Babylonia areolata TaxID=304850 RepID=UPI003FCF7DF3